MRKIVSAIFLVFFFFAGINAQNIVKGIVTDSDSENPLPSVLVTVLNTTFSQETGSDGVFSIKNIPNGIIIYCLNSYT